MYNCRQIIINESQVPCITPISSLIREFQALPALPTIDVYINDVWVTRNLRYKDMAQYKVFCLTSYNIKIFPAGNREQTLADIKNIQVPLGQIITFAITGSVDNIKILPIIDNINERVTIDQTKIRFYNLDNSVISFQMSLPNGSINDSLAYSEGTQYNLINPGSHRFQLTSENPNIQPIDINIDLNPGRIYTLYVVGSIDVNSPGYKTGNVPQIILSVDGNTLNKACVG